MNKYRGLTILCAALLLAPRPETIRFGEVRPLHAINVFRTLKDAVTGDDKLGEKDLERLEKLDGVLAEAFGGREDPLRAAALRRLAEEAERLDTSEERVRELYGSFGWEGETLRAFWDHVFDAMEEDEDWEKPVRLLTSMLHAVRENSGVRGGSVRALALDGEYSELLLLCDDRLFYCRRALEKDDKPEMLPAAELALVGRLPDQPGRLLLVSSGRGLLRAAPVLITGKLVLAEGLEKLREHTGDDAPEVERLLYSREDRGLLQLEGQRLILWERIEADDKEFWSCEELSFRDIETVFSESVIRDDYAALVLADRVAGFDDLSESEKLMFDYLAHEVEKTLGRARLDIGGVRVADRYYLYEFPEVVRLMAGRSMLGEDETLVSLAVGNTAGFDRSSLLAFGLSARNVLNLPGAVMGAAGRLGESMVSRLVDEVSFAAVTDRRFIACHRGEVSYYELAEGLPFALRVDKVNSNAVDFYERDFFDVDKPLVDDVHVELARSFSGVGRDVVRGRKTDLSWDGLEDRARGEVADRLGLVRDSVSALVESAPAAARKELAGRLGLEDNEKGYAGLLRKFIGEGSLDDNRATLLALREASGISGQRAAEIERGIRDEIMERLEIKPAERGFAGMARRFIEQGTLESNSGLLDELAVASGIDDRRKRELIRLLLEEQAPCAAQEIPEPSADSIPSPGAGRDSGAMDGNDL